MSAPIPVRTARTAFGFHAPTIHEAAGVRAECSSVNGPGGLFAAVHLSFIDRHGNVAPMTAYFDAASVVYAHALAHAINAVPLPAAPAAE